MASTAIVIASAPARAGNADAARTAQASAVHVAPGATGQAFAPFNARGIGTSKFFASGDCATAVGDAALACPIGDVCFCWQINVPMHSAQIANTTLTMDLDFDISQSVSNGTATGLCLPGAGLGLLKPSKGGAINVGFSGIECDSTVGTDGSFIGSGSFQFSGGTGKFGGAIGLSAAAITASFSPTGPATVAIDGGLNQ